MSYAGLIGTASSLIKAKGTACKWNRAQQTPNPDKPWEESAGIDIQYDTHIVVLPFDVYSRRTLSYSDGRAIPAGTLVGYLPGSDDFTPALRDTVAIGSTVYTVAAIDVFNPNADSDIIYVVELRQ